MLILAFDDQQELNELHTVLKQILGGNLQFRGFDSVQELLKTAEKNGYDVVFVNMEIQNRRGVLLLGELAFRYPKTNYVGTATVLSNGDAMTMHHIHGRYIIKPYEREIISDTLNYLRYPVRETVL